MRVEGLTLTQASKTELIDALSLAIERQEVRLLSDPVQMSELMGYRADRLPSGAMRYGAASGAHDDTVVALALALAAVQRGSGGISFVTLPPITGSPDPYRDSVWAYLIGGDA